MEKAVRQEYNAPALEKGLDILELLASVAGPMSKKQIAETVGRSVGEIFRVLSVLTRRGYVTFHEESGKYEFSMQMFNVANQYPPQSQLLNVAKPLMKELSEKVNQSCHISWYDSQHLVVIGREESPYKMGFSLKIGAKLDVCSSGSGIVLLSFCDSQKREKIFKQSGATENEMLQAKSQIEQTKKLGYFIGPSPQISGIMNISVPIFSGLDFLAVLTVPYVTLDSDAVHHAVDSIETTKNELLEICRTISCQLTPGV
ncbi:IclR family transcriptional regulator [Photobacterium sp. ZSDE20]|uniref:IclR family transcriptional regulator n=1 Tax=Photobacterium pectinilyticum TaxID=2906793 RepID=A0ABT1N4M8_9GAMM|nr:IclR family transcriptional regulator [Photobacterium sp. ZSDE20]MCQ1059665.1 IclR family transcriptional regulator [Photobacterium sp. ZSDE20]MDD1825821.1 IclR family transcriptional regulator [Photobacterium sp. ZSDE20]